MTPHELIEKWRVEIQRSREIAQKMYADYGVRDSIQEQRCKILEECANELEEAING